MPGYILGILPLFTAVLVAIAGTTNLFYRNNKATAIFISVLFAALGIEGILSLSYISTQLSIGIIYATPFSSFFTMLFGFALLIATLIAYQISERFERFAFMLGFITIGIILIVSASSLLELVLALELVSIPTSFIIIFGGKKRLEPASKFFILSGLAIAILTFAIAISLQGDPSFAITPMHPGLPSAIIVLIALLFAIALSFEASLFPFNLWVPDVYEGAPGEATALLAGVNKKIAFVIIFEVFFVLLSAYRAEFSGIFALLAIVTMFFGNIVALVQDSVKRMFAYSAISQAGYITIGLAVGTSFGLQSSIFQIFAHTFMIMGAFAIVAALEFKGIKSYREYSGLFYRNKFVAISLTLIMLSMAGIPPLIGFDGKLFLFSSAVEANMVYLAVIGIINSLISIYYYARLINFMFTEKDVRKVSIGFGIAAAVAISIFVIVVIGIYPTVILHYAELATSL